MLDLFFGDQPEGIRKNILEDMMGWKGVKMEKKGFPFYTFSTLIISPKMCKIDHVIE